MSPMRIFAAIGEYDELMTSHASVLSCPRWASKTHPCPLLNIVFPPPRLLSSSSPFSFFTYTMPCSIVFARPKRYGQTTLLIGGKGFLASHMWCQNRFWNVVCGSQRVFGMSYVVPKAFLECHMWCPKVFLESHRWCPKGFGMSYVVSKGFLEHHMWCPNDLSRL